MTSLIRRPAKVTISNRGDTVTAVGIPEVMPWDAAEAIGKALLHRAAEAKKFAQGRTPDLKVTRSGT